MGPDVLGVSVLIRADATAARGGGHVARCIAVAEALAMRGATVELATRPETFAFFPDFGETFAAVHRLDAAAGDLPPGERRWDLAVIDGYDLGVAVERAVSARAGVVVAFDDFPGRPHAVDVLIDQTLGRRADAYSDLVPPGARILAGADYICLDRSFATARRATLAGAAPRLFVSAGLTDPRGILGLLLRGVAPVEGVVVDAVLGNAAPHLAEIEATIAADMPHVRLHRQPSRAAIIALMSRAVLGVAASGISAWERCALGLPSVAVVGGDNQVAVAEALAAEGASAFLGRAADLDPAVVTRAVADLLAAPDKLAAMGAAAARVCDGRGADRVAEVLLKAVGKQAPVC